MANPKYLSLIVFAVVWPPLGFLTFLLLILCGPNVTQGSCLSMVSDMRGSDLLRILFDGTFTGYILGIIPALAAGKITSSLRRLDSRFEIVLVALAGLLTGLAYWSCISLISGEGPARGINIYLLTCTIPTMICWALTRAVEKRTGSAS